MLVTYDKNLLPKKWSEWATCLDLFVAEEIEIFPWEVVLVPTWIKTDFASKIYARSSLAYKRKLMLANNIGIIDKDYRWEIKVMLWNFGNTIQILEKWERVAQIEFDWYELFEVDEWMYNVWESIDESKRWNGWFGSTGN